MKCSIGCYINDNNIERQERDISMQISLWLNMLPINSIDILYDLFTLTDFHKNCILFYWIQTLFDSIWKNKDLKNTKVKLTPFYCFVETLHECLELCISLNMASGRMATNVNYKVKRY